MDVAGDAVHGGNVVGTRVRQAGGLKQLSRVFVRNGMVVQLMSIRSPNKDTADARRFAESLEFE